MPPVPSPAPYRVLQIDNAPGMADLESTLNEYAKAGYKFVGIINAPSLGVSVILEHQG